ncbi:MAG TPA: beta-propeller fold lactonase family protein [Acidobacteriaceae bacterium]|nr:beta-propeller fold lactonase family protein [Acidobacteriaceae bacterium]
MIGITKRTSKRRVLKASILSLAVGLGLTACSNDYTVSYVYMITQGVQGATNHSLINSYQVDYQSGFLYNMPDSPNDTGGRDGVAIVVAPNNLFLYTVNNFDSTVVEFAIGTDGKLYPQHTYNIAGSLPVAAAIDPAGKFLYVAYTYQTNPDGSQLYTTSNPGPGGITVFPIYPAPTKAGDPDQNSLGPPTTFPVGRNPVAIATSPTGNYVYLAEQDSASGANLLGFTVTVVGSDPSTHLPIPKLTPMPGVTINSGNVPSFGFSSGPTPSGLLVDSSATHLYVTDKTLNQVATYSIGPGGVLGPATITQTDAGPMGMSFDLSGKYLYVAANIANAVDIYNIGANGVPVRSTVQPAAQAGNGPTCVTVSGAPSNAHPTHAVYLYVSNSLSNTVTAEQLNESTGALNQILGTPFTGSELPACIVTAPALPLR